jgi:hypothetical protein
MADPYNATEVFLKRLHQWFGARSPDELMASEAGQFVLLKFLRGGDHMPPTEKDRDLKSYTTATTDHAIDQAISCLEEQIEQLKSFKGSGPEIATVMERVQEVFGERGVIWLIRPNQVLQAIPLDLIRQGKTDRVLRLLVQIEHGILP